MTHDMPTPQLEKPKYLNRPDGLKIAYHHVPGKQSDVQAPNTPGVMFLGGFMSDMTGTKATHLEAHCIRQGVAYTRFDYSGHGQSSGKFADGTIGQWAADAIAVLDEITTGPQILVGSLTPLHAKNPSGRLEIVGDTNRSTISWGRHRCRP